MFGRKKEIKIGQGFVNGKIQDGSRKEQIKQILKGRLVAYGHQLKDTYLTPFQKKDIEEEMAKLDRKLKKLEQEEKYAEKLDDIRKKKAKIKRLKGGSGVQGKLKKVDNYASYFHMPDVIGPNTGKVTRTKLLLPGGGGGKPTKLNLPGSGSSKKTGYGLPNVKVKRFI